VPIFRDVEAYYKYPLTNQRLLGTLGASTYQVTFKLQVPYGQALSM
jgi:hypothetical protein